MIVYHSIVYFIIHLPLLVEVLQRAGRALVEEVRPDLPAGDEGGGLAEDLDVLPRLPPLAPGEHRRQGAHRRGLAQGLKIRLRTFFKLSFKTMSLNMIADFNLSV